MKLISWNINGWNSCTQKGLLKFVQREDADIYCFQELKSSDEKIEQGMLGLEKYQKYWICSEKKGYAGVMVLSKKKPLAVVKGLGKKEFDHEGRVLTLEYGKFFLVNIYFPHSQRENARLGYKLKFNRAVENFVKGLEKMKPVVIASDFNVAHKEIDLANPKTNKKNAGFTPEERGWFDKFLKKGYVDTYRMFVEEGGHYTWWTFRFNARARNVGWRIDYFVVSEKLKGKVKNSEILEKVMGSDHCPIRLTL
ncbi:exodeoxyribonuclease III [Nanoarchaeota archaeon]